MTHTTISAINGLTHANENIARHVNNAIYHLIEAELEIARFEHKPTDLLYQIELSAVSTTAKKKPIHVVPAAQTTLDANRGTIVNRILRRKSVINFSDENESGVVIGVTQLDTGSYVLVSRADRSLNNYRLELHSLWHLGWLNNMVSIEASHLIPHYHDIPKDVTMAVIDTYIANGDTLINSLIAKFSSHYGGGFKRGEMFTLGSVDNLDTLPKSNILSGQMVQGKGVICHIHDGALEEPIIKGFAEDFEGVTINADKISSPEIVILGDEFHNVLPEPELGTVPQWVVDDFEGDELTGMLIPDTHISDGESKLQEDFEQRVNNRYAECSDIRMAHLPTIQGVISVEGLEGILSDRPADEGSPADNMNEMRKAHIRAMDFENDEMSGMIGNPITRDPE